MQHSLHLASEVLHLNIGTFLRQLGIVNAEEMRLKEQKRNSQLQFLLQNKRFILWSDSGSNEIDENKTIEETK